MKYLQPIINLLKVNNSQIYIQICGCDHRGHESEVLIKLCDLGAVIDRLRELESKCLRKIK